MWLHRLVIQLQNEIHLDAVGHGEVPHPEISRYLFRYRQISPDIARYRQISPDIARYRAICRPDLKCTFYPRNFLPVDPCALTFNRGAKSQKEFLDSNKIIVDYATRERKKHLNFFSPKIVSQNSLNTKSTIFRVYR